MIVAVPIKVFWIRLSTASRSHLEKVLLLEIQTGLEKECMHDLAL